MKHRLRRPRKPPERQPSKIFFQPRSFFAALLAVFFLVATAAVLPATVTAQDDADSVRAQRDYRSGVGLLRDEDYSLARRQFEDFLQRYPDSPLRGRASLGLGRAHFGLDEYEQAAAAFLQALEEGELSDQQYDMALGQGAETALRADRADLAGEFLVHANAGDLDEYEESTFVLLVRLLREDNQLDEALRYADELVERFPGDQASYRKADLLARTGNYTEALDALDQVSDYDALPEARFLRAETRLQLDMLSEARSDFQRLLEQEELVHESRFGLAWVHIEQEDWDEADALLEQVAREGPDDLAYEATRDRARLARMLRDVDQAEEFYADAFDRVPSDRRSNLAREIGDYLVAVDRVEQAVPYYEAVEDRPLEARQNLIRGYLSAEQYAQARDELEAIRDREGLPNPQWELLLARAYLKLGSIEEAEVHLPDPDRLEDPHRLEARLIRGRIFLEQERWEEADDFFQDWRREVSASEGRYYLGMIAEARGEADEAKEYWNHLIREADEPWVSRAALQLLRLNGDLDSERRYDLEDHINEQHLTPNLNLEYSLIQFRQALQDGEHIRETAINELLQRAQDLDRLTDVYAEVLNLPSDHEAWGGLIPALFERDETFRVVRADRALLGMIEAGEVDRARELAERYLEQPVTRSEQTGLLVGYAELLRRDRRLDELEPYLPPEEALGDWSGANARQVGHLMAQTYRQIQELSFGRNQLMTLADHNRDDPETLARLDEWIAGFEIDLGEFGRAEQRLAEVPDRYRTPHGELNRALAEYHRGNVDAAYGRLGGLMEDWPDGPLRMYEYYLRSARHAGTHADVRDGLDQMLDHYEMTRLDVQQIMIDVSRFWMSEGEQEEALFLLDTLREVVEGETLVAVDFFRGTARFNREEYDRAEEIWTSLDEQELESPWRERVLRQLVEVNIQTNRWGEVFRHWERLDELGEGGEVGRRILSAEALVEEEPGSVEDVLARLEDEYADHLEEGESTYWRARLDLQEGNFEAARDGFTSYLDEGHEVYREDSRRNLVVVYRELGEQERARQVLAELWEDTGDLSDLLESVRIQRDLGEAEAAYNRLAAEQDEFAGTRRMRVEFELGILARDLGRWSQAEDHFETVRTGEDTREEDGIAAGFYQAEAMLNQDRLDAAGDLIRDLPDEPNRWLIEAEWNRRTGELDRARELVDRVRQEEDELRPDLQSIAMLVYRDQEDHEAIVDLFPTTPERPEHQDQLFTSYIELNRLEDAERLFHRLDSELVPSASRELGDLFYEQEEWRRARTYYRETLDSPRSRYRLGRIAVHLDRHEEAWAQWSEGLELEPGERWMAALLGGLSELVPEKERWADGLEILEPLEIGDPELSNQIDQLGLWWALKAGDTEAIDRYLDRVRERNWAYHDRIGRMLLADEDWTRLEQWQEQTRQYATDWDERELAYETYEGQIRLRAGEVDGLEGWIDERIDRAEARNSDALVRYYRLLGEWALETGDYERAAIEFHRVTNDFDDPFEIDLARIGLGMSYAQLGQPDRAETQFQQVIDGAEDPRLEARAHQLLEAL